VGSLSEYQKGSPRVRKDIVLKTESTPQKAKRHSDKITDSLYVGQKERYFTLNAQENKAKSRYQSSEI
jgi:hypothetical protein